MMKSPLSKDFQMRHFVTMGGLPCLSDLDRKNKFFFSHVGEVDEGSIGSPLNRSKKSGSYDAGTPIRKDDEIDLLK